MGSVFGWLCSSNENIRHNRKTAVHLYSQEPLLSTIGSFTILLLIFAILLPQSVLLPFFCLQLVLLPFFCNFPAILLPTISSFAICLQFSCYSSAILLPTNGLFVFPLQYFCYSFSTINSFAVLMHFALCKLFSYSSATLLPTADSLANISDRSFAILLQHSCPLLILLHFFAIDWPPASSFAIL